MKATGTCKLCAAPFEYEVHPKGIRPLYCGAECRREVIRAQKRASKSRKRQREAPA